MATKAKVTSTVAVDPAAAPDQAAAADTFAALLVDPVQIAAEAEATTAAINTQRRAILARLALATQISEADLAILFGLPA